MVHAPTCPHEILYKSSVLWRVRPRSRFHTPASANQSRSAAPLTAAFRLTLKASWRPLLAACSVPNDPEPSWTFQRTMENFSELLTQRQPGFQGVGMRHHTDWWHIHTSGMVYVARLSQRQKLRRWQGRVVKWQKAVDWELTGKKKAKLWYNLHIAEICLWKICPGDLKPLQATEAKFHQQKELRAPTTVAIHHGIQSDLGATVESWNMRYIILYIYIYIIYIIYIYYIYIHIYIARGLMFARNPRNSMQDCNLLCSLGACFFWQTANIQNIVISYVSWHFCAYLLRCQNHLLKHVLKRSSAICNVSNCWLKPQQTRLWKSTNITNPKNNEINHKQL